MPTTAAAGSPTLTETGSLLVLVTATDQVTPKGRLTGLDLATNLAAVSTQLAEADARLSVRIVLLDAVGLPQLSLGDESPNSPAQAGPKLARGHSFEHLNLTGRTHGELLRRGLDAAGPAPWILRLPAWGLRHEFLPRLLARRSAGVVPADIVVGVRPRRAGWWRAIHETLWAWVFGIVTSDPDSPVVLLSGAAAAASRPSANSPWADYELLARANFLGFLIDELPLRDNWLGPPAPAQCPWLAMWAEAYHLLGHPNFPRGPLPKTLVQPSQRPPTAGATAPHEREKPSPRPGVAHAASDSKLRRATPRDRSGRSAKRKRAK